MQKISSLFQRNYHTDHLVRDEVVLCAEWVLAGEGVATRKWDGTCCLVKDERLFRRYEVKNGRTAPPGFVAAQDPDPITGDCPGWIEVGDGPADKWHREAIRSTLFDGTYELCGPAIQGNPEGFGSHILIRHGEDPLVSVPRTFDALRAYLATHNNIEGVVWHHTDGRMVKIKGKDFGIRRVPAVVPPPP